MALSYSAKSVSGIGVTPTEIVAAVAAGKTGFLNSLILANITGASINVSAKITRADASTSHIVKDAPLPTGSSIEVIEHTLILGEGDTVTVWSSVAASMDATSSVVERS